jgi:hypothetical protein
MDKDFTGNNKHTQALMLRPSFALDCHCTLQEWIPSNLLIGGHRRSERLGPNIGRQG